jgi:hypothetical protein
MRYKLRCGKFGFYFYDSITKKDLPLKKVENLLNGLYEECLERGKQKEAGREDD